MFKPRAQRNLRRLTSFKSPSVYKQIKNSDWLDSFLDEGAIGYYENSKENPLENVFFSNQAFYYQSENSWHRVDYMDIESLYPEKQKDTASLIKMKCSGDKIVAFPVNGDHEGFRDYFVIYQFLHRVIGDLSSK